MSTLGIRIKLILKTIKMPFMYNRFLTLKPTDAKLHKGIPKPDSCHGKTKIEYGSVPVESHRT
jgi:hypothetical protein